MSPPHRGNPADNSSDEETEEEEEREAGVAPGGAPASDQAKDVVPATAAGGGDIHILGGGETRAPGGLW